MSVAALDLDLEVFQGPFDLLLTLVLREEVDLLESPIAQLEPDEGAVRFDLHRFEIKTLRFSAR